jgi:poly(3-hydroxybutyrate) depolymerase
MSDSVSISTPRGANKPPRKNRRMRQLFRFVLVATFLWIATVGSAHSTVQAISSLEEHLAIERSARPALASLPWAGVALSKDDAATAKELLWKDHVKHIRETRGKEIDEKILRVGEQVMRFDYRVFGEKPTNGHSLYISMHGGGGAPKALNDQQWENQKILYRPAEGIYLAPRAPTDTWNLWHQAPIDQFFGRLIEDLIVLGEVDPNRVYLMGYSAGGDGVYQLAPRMADRWAAAAMMAGHPNETSAVGLRNVPFAIHVGEHDSGYNRNEVARKWRKGLVALKKSDPGGYEHLVQLHAGKGHWMDRQDAAAVPWMATFTRNPLPDRVVWLQDDVLHDRYYWLAVPKGEAKKKTGVVATRDGQTIAISSNDVDEVIVLLNDEMLDLDETVDVKFNGVNVFRGKATRTITSIADTLSGRGDPHLVFSAQVVANAP